MTSVTNGPGSRRRLVGLGGDPNRDHGRRTSAGKRLPTNSTDRSVLAESLGRLARMVSHIFVSESPWTPTTRREWVARELAAKYGDRFLPPESLTS